MMRLAVRETHEFRSLLELREKMAALAADVGLMPLIYQDGTWARSG
jgi:hypothetical protein